MSLNLGFSLALENVPMGPFLAWFLISLEILKNVHVEHAKGLHTLPVFIVEHAK